MSAEGTSVAAQLEDLFAQRTEAGEDRAGQIAALRRERAGYLTQGRPERADAVTAALAVLGDAPPAAPERPTRRRGKAADAAAGPAEDPPNLR